MPRSRRRENGEIAFGSDSFLDIVANIVGILIILIVIVGVRVKNAPARSVPTRVGRQPPGADDAARRAEWESARERIEAVNRRRKESRDLALAARSRELRLREQRAAARKRRQLELDADLQAGKRQADEQTRLAKRFQREAQQLQGEVGRLRAQAKAVRDAAREREETLDQRKASLESKRSEIGALEGLLLAQLDKRKSQNERLAELRSDLEQVESEIDTLESAKRPAKRRIHYPTPIARRVKTEELHYRCLGGRVAYTHLDVLLDRVKREIDVRTLMTRPVVNGSVGPVGGFQLHYSLARSSRSLTAQLHDPFSVSIQISSWELAAGSAEIGETFDEALREDSSFLESLAHRASRVHAVTLWVYPDSFELATKLRNHMHQRGYAVALRPLPHGISIAGSPWGSASQVE